MKINAIIIEDDQVHAKRLQNLLELNHKDIEIITICKTVIDGIANINYYRPDLIFVDIQLDTAKGGFEILEKLIQGSYHYYVIFTTSHMEYENDVKQLEFCGLDFLLKPIQKEELSSVLKNYKKLGSLPNSNNKVKTLITNSRQVDFLQQQIVIRHANGSDFITVGNILYCESDDNYTNFYLKEGKPVKASKNLGHYEDLLNYPCFFRVHNSYLVNMNHISRYTNNGTAGLVTLASGNDIPVAKAKKKAFKDAYKAYKPSIR